eukprot:TRINITY_DN1333_c0_g1_i1.p1 TRINITY_DN1333_c0_g1~~TRINITY_DN1333_c0_g1_i1.p1  ORF type:complete len:76 (+),score=25.19 TRINITY_DN1333_c0_g1_i1:56-283(+)
MGMSFIFKKMEISPFWCKWDLISKRYSFPSLPLKLHEIFCRGPPNQRNMSSIFRQKSKKYRLRGRSSETAKAHRG